VVPGLSRGGDAPDDRPDVMRGEETQVVGALALRPALARGALVILPGTHAKWVAVADGRVRDFATFMTGELFALLRDHSLLGRPARAAATEPAPEEREEAFARGVLTARDAGQGLAPLLFATRALVLAGRLAPAASLDYLSGLLVGDELRAGLASPLATAAAGRGEPPLLVGEPALCRRYAVAFQLLGVPDAATLAGGAASAAGLWQIASRAGLVHDSTSRAPRVSQGSQK
jgi:2-dehydro-3-deoxygalactonokinase